jgi:hypothetical protein
MKSLLHLYSEGRDRNGPSAEVGNSTLLAPADIAR